MRRDYPQLFVPLAWILRTKFFLWLEGCNTPYFGGIFVCIVMYMYYMLYIYEDLNLVLCCCAWDISSGYYGPTWLWNWNPSLAMYRDRPYEPRPRFSMPCTHPLRGYDALSPNHSTYNVYYFILTLRGSICDIRSSIGLGHFEWTPWPGDTFHTCNWVVIDYSQDFSRRDSPVCNLARWAVWGIFSSWTLP